MTFSAPHNEHADAERFTNAERDASHFLAEIFRLSTPGAIVVTWDTNPHSWRSRRCKAPWEATQAALKYSPHYNVFFGVGRRTPGKGRRVVAVTCAWIDCDPPDKDAATLNVWRDRKLDELRSFTPSPSIVVNSGHGLHAYWLLSETAAPEYAQRVNEALAERLGGDRRSCDPSRVLRVPGTFNRKKGAPPCRVDLVRSWWSPDHETSAQRYRLDELPVLVARKPAGRDYSELLRRVLEHGRNAKHGTDGKVTLSCLFSEKHAHGDANPSAVVFPDGNYWCSTCSKLLFPQEWTRLPQVAEWGAPELILAAPRKAAGAELVLASAEHFAVPGMATRIVGKLLAPHRTTGQVEAVLKRGTEVSLFDRAADRAIFRDAADLARELNRSCGPLTFKTFYGVIACHSLWKMNGRHGPEVMLSLSDKRAGGPCLAELLGFKLDSRGCLTGGRSRRELREAFEAVQGIKVAFSWSEAAPQIWRGQIIAAWERRDQEGRGLWGVRLHPGLAAQLKGGPAWHPAKYAALQAPADILAVHIEVACRVWEELQRETPRRQLHYELPAIAERAGAWNTNRYRHDRTAYVNTWAQGINARPKLGMKLEVSTETLRVGVDAVIDSSLLSTSHPIEAERRALPVTP